MAKLNQQPLPWGQKKKLKTPPLLKGFLTLVGSEVFENDRGNRRKIASTLLRAGCSIQLASKTGIRVCLSQTRLDINTIIHSKTCSRNIFTRTHKTHIHTPYYPGYAFKADCMNPWSSKATFSSKSKSSSRYKVSSYVAAISIATSPVVSDCSSVPSCS